MNEPVEHCSNQSREDSEEKLKPSLTTEFLSTLRDTIEVCGWSCDLVELISFLDWCTDLAEVDRMKVEDRP